MLLSLFLILGISSLSPVSSQICNPFCDGFEAVLAACPIREAADIHVNGRRLVLRVSDSANTAWALATDADMPNDEVWLDRTWNGGRSHEELLGRQHIREGVRHVVSLMYNIDDPPAGRVGAIRACGNLGGQTACTAWARSKVHSESRLDAAVTAMMMFYERDRGLFGTVGWWNAANDITALIDYQRYTGRNDFQWAFENTFERNKGRNEFGGENFCSGSIDDTLWWGLAWLRAFDLTQDRKYLDMAVIIADFAYQYHDDECGGGLWTSDNIGEYKNAVVNEQYIKLSAQLHNRIEGDSKFGDQSRRLWDWFMNIGMINEDSLINDGLYRCGNNWLPTWTYNQGIILGAAVELWKATGDENYLREARRLADASTRHPDLNDEHGGLREPPPHCHGADANCACFKGIFIRNLLELNMVLEDRPYNEYILKQAELNFERNRNSIDQYGLYWSGPLDMIDASRQQSAVDSLIAAEVILRDNYLKK